MCPEEIGDKVAMGGQGGPCWEMVVEWLVLRLQSRTDGKRLQDVSLRIYKPPDSESPVLSVVGSAGRGRSRGLNTGSLVEIREQHIWTPFFPICSGEQRFIYSPPGN